MPATRWLGLLAAWALLIGTPGAARPVDGSVQVRPHPGGRFSLEAVEAPFSEVAVALERTGCRVELAPELREERLTLSLSPRSAERLVRGAARWAGLRLSLHYRLEPGEAAEGPARGRRPFADAPTMFPGPVRLTLSELRQYLGIHLEAMEGEAGLEQMVRIAGGERPLRRVLDQAARQLGGHWEPVARLGRYSAPDADAVAHNRMHAHYAHLASLSPRERREELLDEIEWIEALPDEARASETHRLAADVLSLARLFESVPGEHRGNTAPFVGGILADYQTVLHRLPRERREPFGALLAALAETHRRLRALR
jgi:hypothetical protein